MKKVIFLGKQSQFLNHSINLIEMCAQGIEKITEPSDEIIVEDGLFDVAEEIFANNTVIYLESWESLEDEINPNSMVLGDCNLESEYDDIFVFRVRSDQFERMKGNYKFYKGNLTAKAIYNFGEYKLIH